MPEVKTKGQIVNEAQEQRLQTANRDAYKKPKSSEKRKVEIHKADNGITTKTIEKKTYTNGVVKNRLVDVKKNKK